MDSKEWLKLFERFALAAARFALKNESLSAVNNMHLVGLCTGALKVDVFVFPEHQYNVLSILLFDMNILRRHAGKLSMEERKAQGLLEPAWQIVGLELSTEKSGYRTQPCVFTPEEEELLRSCAPVPYGAVSIEGTVEVVAHKDGSMRVKVNPEIFEGEQSLAQYHFCSRQTFKLAQDLAELQVKCFKLEAELRAGLEKDKRTSGAV